MSDKPISEFLGKNHPFRQYMVRFKLTSEKVSAKTGLSESSIRTIYRTGTALKPTIKALSVYSGIREDVLMYPELNPDFDVSICNPPDMTTSVNC